MNRITNERDLQKWVNATNEKINRARSRGDLMTVANLTAQMRHMREQFIREERMTMDKALEDMPVNVKYDLSRRIQQISIPV